MNLDLSSLIKGVQRREEGVARSQAEPDDDQIRDGLIQRFEFTYELAHKMLKRYLEMVSATPGEFDRADFQYLIRSGNERGLLLGDWPPWQKYREMHAKTSHTYDAEVALAVAREIPTFLEEVRHLRDPLLQSMT